MLKCGFIGHRDSFGIEDKVYSEIRKLMESGIREFYSGGMGNFDKICERAVKELGGKIVFVPYNLKAVKSEDIEWYDEIICPFGSKAYEKSDIPKRNEWLVATCDVFLCNVYKEGCAIRTIGLVASYGKEIINVAE